MRPELFPEDAVVEYEFNGGIKYAGYALTPDHMIVVVTADKDEIVKPVNQMIWFMSITAGITLVVCVIIGYLLSRFICTPLEHLTEIIKNTADLNFSHNAKSDGLCKRTDETGFYGAGTPCYEKKSAWRWLQILTQQASRLPEM